MEPIRGPRGRGHAKDKNALPPALLHELGTAVYNSASNPGTKVILDLCSGFQSWRDVAAKLGCKYIAVDICGDRDKYRNV